MRRNVTLLSCWLGWLGLLAATKSGWAAPTGLLVIPTAGIMSPGELALEIQRDTAGLVAGYHEALLVNTTWGISPTLEAGLDLDLSCSRPRLLFDCKWQASQPGRSKPGIALGLYSLGDGSKPRAYLVNSIGKQAGLHIGIDAGEGSPLWMAGVHWPIESRRILMADFVSSPSRSFSMGICGEYIGGLNYALGWQWIGEGEELFTVRLGWCGRFQGMK